MPKPPRGQSRRNGPTRTGTPRSKERPGGRADTRRDSGERGQSERSAEGESAQKREKTVATPKKPGWARAAPPKKTPWRAKSREDAAQDRAPRTARGKRQHIDEPEMRDAPSKRPRRVRPVAGRTHVERPDSRLRRGKDQGGSRAEQTTKRNSERGANHRPPSDDIAKPARNERHRRPDRRTSDTRADRAYDPPLTRRVAGNRAATASDGAPASIMRIAKAMARAGLCSRRDAEQWIEEGRVKVNGAKIASPALDVGPGDRILVDDNPLPMAEPTRLWRFSKPRGVVTTHRDPEGRPTVFDALPDDMPRVMSIGRLDYNTEGLLLLTTDGELARYLELPATGWLRRYRVRAHGRILQADLDALKEGVEVDGIRYAAIEATLDSQQGANVWLTLGLREGKNREVRNILASLGLEVNRLIRTSFGPFQLLDMKPGAVELVRRKVLIEQLGVRLASRFNLAADDDQVAHQPKSLSRAPQAARSNADRSNIPRRDDEQAPRKQKSKDKRGGNPRGSKPKGGTSFPVDPETVDIDETKLDDIKPWGVKSEGTGQRNHKRSSTKAARAPRKPKRS